MEYLTVTNNPRVIKRFSGPGLCSMEGPVLSLFLKVRDLIHQGHRLLTHPLCGNLKPGRIPYKTVFLTAERAALDPDSLHYIENSIATCRKTAPEYPVSRQEQHLADYAAIDLSHVEAALESMGHPALHTGGAENEQL